MRNVPILGLTGPTGSGKSVVAAYLSAHGAAIIDCDAVAREVTEVGHPCLQALAQAFSSDILREDGSLDRARLASLAFADEAGRRRLNAVTHPYISERCRARIRQLCTEDVRAVVLDAPLLFESGLDRDCTTTAAVLAPSELRLQRIMARDGLSETAARLRMSAQPDDAFYRARAARILYNDGSRSALYQQTEEWLLCVLC